jgi:SWI/SNF-related matrix-associated actin-dependent regulator of chromatin subfamily A-like protein 1
MRNSKIYRKKIFNTAKLAKFPNGRRAILLKFTPDKRTIYNIKTILGYEYYGDGSWSVPVSIESIERLANFKFMIDEKLLDVYRRMKYRKIEPIFPDGLKKKLLDFQGTGVGFLDLHDGNGIIGDEQGLGKTVQGLGYLQYRMDLRPAVIICTKSTKLNWEYEAKQWLSKCKVQVLSGKPQEIKCKDIVIVNYDILANNGTKVKTEDGEAWWETPLTGWIDYIIRLNPKIIITDEIQKYKNDKAQRSQAVIRIARSVPHLIQMSGTPIENRPMEAFNALNLANPRLFPNRFKFGHQFCGAKNNGFGWDFSGHSNEDKLHLLLQQVMIRRLKSEVLKELPPKRFSYVPLELETTKEYKEAENDFIQYVRRKAKAKFDESVQSVRKVLKSNLNKEYTRLLEEEKQEFVDEVVYRTKSAEELIQTGVLLRIAAQAKLNNALEWIDDFLETGEKLVIFARHKAIVSAIMNRYKKIATKIDGSTSETARQQAIVDFQTKSKYQVIVITEAAAEGITLTAAHNIAIVELPLVPGRLDQIVDRLHRIGQLKNVIVHYLLAENTIEMKFAKMLDDKRKVISSVVDGKRVDEEQLIMELINEYAEVT